MSYALYTNEQLNAERSKGLELTDYENENFYAPSNSKTYNWSKEEFESYLSTREWAEHIKENHRNKFTGTITFEDGKISYD